MTVFLRQSTARDIRVGPFVDVGDGFTPETGVTIAASDEAEILKHDGAATVTMAGTFAAITGADGWYDYTLSTGDTDTVGELVVVMQDDSVYLPVFVRAYVVEEEVYDDLYAASSVGYLKPVTGGNDLDVTATGAAGVDWGNVENQATVVDLSATDIQLCDTVTTLTGHTNQTGDSFAVVNSGTFGNAQLVRSTTPANTLDVAATGEAGVDLGNVIGTLGNANVGWIDGSDRVDVGSVLGTAQSAGDIMASLGEENAAAAVADPSTTESVMQYVKQLVNVIIGSTGVGTMPTGLDFADGANLFEILRAMAGSGFLTATDSLEQLQADGAAIQTEVDKIALADAGAGVAGSVIEEVENRATPAQVNTEVVDVMNTDTITLPGQVAPPLTPTHREAIGHLYKAYRNRKTQTSTLWTLRADNETTVDQQATVSDDGTTAIKEEIVIGV